MSEKLKEALYYFKSEQKFNTLFNEIRKKYESLGRFGGTIKLDKLTEHEIEALALYMGLSPHHLKQRGKIMVEHFEERLKQTRFAEISLLTLIEGYYDERLLSKKSRYEELIAQHQAKLSEFYQLYPQLRAWFSYLEQRSKDTQWIWRIMLEQQFADDIGVLATAYHDLPEHIERYALFSQRTTGNPHALDIGTVRGKLWIHLLHVMEGGQGVPPSQSELVSSLLLRYRLLRDDIQNFVTQANLIAYNETKLNPIWKSAVDEGSVLNVPIRELFKVSRVEAAEGNGKVFIVENSGVFSALLDVVPDAPLICTHGQFKLAGLQLMDFLHASGHKLYYSGDFDPEGLSMAIRFKERYGDRASLWRMSITDYEKSNPSVDISDRETKLDNLLESELGHVASAIRNKGKAGYQEGIMSLLINDLMNR